MFVELLLVLHIPLLHLQLLTEMLCFSCECLRLLLQGLQATHQFCLVAACYYNTHCQVLIPARQPVAHCTSSVIVQHAASVAVSLW